MYYKCIILFLYEISEVKKSIFVRETGGYILKYYSINLYKT